MKTAVVTGVCGILMCVVPAIARAQQAAPSAPPPPRYEGAAQFGFAATRGNSDTQSVNLGGDVIYRASPWTLNFRVGFVRNSADGELSAQSFTFLSRGERAFSKRLSVFGQYDYLRDTFAGVERRNTVSGGVSRLLVDQARHKLKADGGLGYTNEKRVSGDDLSTAVALAGLGYKLKISDTSEFTDDLRFDLAFSSGDDWRFRNEGAITARLTTLFSLKLSNTIRYVNVPPAGFDTTDTITSVALVAKF